VTRTGLAVEGARAHGGLPGQTQLLPHVRHIPLSPAELYQAGSRLALEQHYEPGTIAEEHRGEGGDATVGATILLHHPHALAKTKTYHNTSPLLSSYRTVRVEGRAGSAVTPGKCHRIRRRVSLKTDEARKGPRSGLTAKDLRAYSASCAKAQGYTLEQLKAGLAHTTITTTEGYVQQHTTPVSEVTRSLPPRPGKRRNLGQ
jgi:hypothetical protein